MAQLEQMQKILENTLTKLRSRAETGESEGQLLAVVTEAGTHYFEINHGTKDEAAALAALGQDRRALAVLCMWKGGELDVPSMYFRKGLLDLNPENGEAWILLQGEDRILAKRLADTL